MSFAIGLRILINSFLVFSLSLFSNYSSNYNQHGATGVINTPNARFQAEGNLGLSVSRGKALNKLSLIASPYDWLEASIYYADLTEKPYGQQFGNTQSFKDKGFNFKLLLKEEGSFPAIAVGAYDFGGTGWFSSEYIVMSKAINKMDFSLGLGWGKLSGGGLSFRNPFIELDDNFRFRGKDTYLGGTFNTDYYFSGEEVAPFFSAVYKHNKYISVGLEYDSTKLNDFERNIEFPESNSELSLFFNSQVFKNSFLKLSYIRDSYFNLSFEYKFNFGKKDLSKKYLPPATNTKNTFSDFQKNLDRNNIGLVKVEKTTENIPKITIRQNSYQDLENANRNVYEAYENTIKNGAKIQIENIYLGMPIVNKEYKNVYKSAVVKETGKLPIREYTVIDSYPYFSYSIAPIVRTLVAAREGFIFQGLFLNFDSEIVLNDELLLSFNAKYSLSDNFDRLYIPPLDTYPNQVRSDIKKYLNDSSTGVNIGRLQLDYFKKFKKSHYLNFTVGIMEDMFSGYGFEYLNKREINSIFAWGFESYKFFKRDYQQNFSHQDYDGTTAFVNFYLHEPKFDMVLKTSSGRFLAGDVGTRFDLYKKFKNGTKMGIYFSDTNVSAEQFGEGSFDKGIYLKIPINNGFYDFKWSPLTKDPGAKLYKKFHLYDILERYTN